jgi:hypothetical protein
MRTICFLTLFAFFSSCNLSDETKQLTGGWMFVDEGRRDKVIDGGTNYIPCEVIKYGYNDEFIIAVQRPVENCFLGKDTITYKEGKNQDYYWLISHSLKLTLGPMNEQQFKEAKIKYNVPEDLQVESVY